MTYIEQLRMFTCYIQHPGCEMFISPIENAGNHREVMAVLSAIPEFAGVDNTFADKTMVALRFPARRTVEQSIHELEGPGPNRTNDLIEAMRAALPTESAADLAAAEEAIADGTAFVVDLGTAGKMPVDRTKYRQSIELTPDYCGAEGWVMLSNAAPGQPFRTVLIAIRGKPAKSAPAEDLLSPFFARTGELVIVGIPGLSSGWELFQQPRFGEFVERARTEGIIGVFQFDPKCLMLMHVGVADRLTAHFGADERTT